MKELRRNMRLIGVLLRVRLFLFAGGLVQRSRCTTQGSRWITTQLQHGA